MNALAVIQELVKSFTFHYVSILMKKHILLLLIALVFTFHYVSILIKMAEMLKRKDFHLHSIMSLF